MRKISISETNDYFVSGGKPFFYLADTMWAAFYNPTLEEWEEYLEYRRRQGYNVVQISVLPLNHESPGKNLGVFPFHATSNGKWNYYKYNEEFFQRADKIVDMAAEKGFVVALVLLWANFVKDTWASQFNPDKILPYDAVKPYTEYVSKKFAKYNPMYIISGDTDFQTEDTVKYYKTAMETIKYLYPDALTGLHTSPRVEDLPAEIEESPDLNIYMYQSGHSWEDQHLTYDLARHYYNKPIKRPIINTEPCYEGHGYAMKYGRFTDFDVRKAFWQSILSGAKAGFTYGNHGLWRFHRRWIEFTEKKEKHAKLPFEWRDCLRFKGAKDIAFGKYLFENYSLYNIEPVDYVLKYMDGIKMAASPDLSKIVIYVPYATDVTVKLDLSDYDLKIVELQERNVLVPDVETKGDTSIIKIYDYNSDAVIFGFKR